MEANTNPEQTIMSRLHARGPQEHGAARGSWRCLAAPRAPGASSDQLVMPKFSCFYCLFVSLDDVTQSHADVAHVSCCSRLLLFQTVFLSFFL